MTDTSSFHHLPPPPVLETGGNIQAAGVVFGHPLYPAPMSSDTCSFEFRAGLSRLSLAPFSLSYQWVASLLLLLRLLHTTRSHRFSSIINLAGGDLWGSAREPEIWVLSIAIGRLVAKFLCSVPIIVWGDVLSIS